MVRKAEDVNAHMGPICDAKDMLDPKLWMRKSIESFFLLELWMMNLQLAQYREMAF